MIDVEALRLNKPWMAPLMEVGLVGFDETGSVTKEHQVWVKPGTHPKWATPEESTVEFWKSQSYWPKLQEQMRNKGTHCKQTLAVVHTWALDADVIWFAGPTYDQVMLEAYFDYYKMKRPWEFNATRDLRTIRKQHPELYTALMDKRKGHHNALADCQFQVSVLREINRATGHTWK